MNKPPSTSAARSSRAPSTKPCLLVAAAWALSIGSACSQVQLVGEHLLYPAVAEINASQTPLIYKSITKSGIGLPLYFTPMFVFENAHDGRLRVDLSEGASAEAPCVVVLSVIPSPGPWVELLASAVRRWAADNPTAKDLVGIGAASLIPAELRSLAVTEEVTNGASPTFEPFLITDEIFSQQKFFLRAVRPTKQAAVELADRLRAGAFKPTFKVVYTLFAIQTGQTGSAELTGIDLRNSQAVASLKGAGKVLSFNVSTTNQTTSVGNGTLVTRDQKQRFEASLKQEISVHYIVSNKDQLPFLDQKLKEYSDRLFQSRDVALADLHTQLANLSAYGFSSADLAPDQVEKLAVQAKDFFQSENQDKLAISASTSGSYMGFGGSVSGSYSKEELRKLMTDKGWNFETEGNFTVPKSLQVYSVNDQALNSAFSVDVSVREVFRNFTPFVAEISTATGFDPAGAGGPSAQPSGVIMPFAGSEASKPDGWLMCDGKSYARKDYERLFQAIGYRFGGDPSKEVFNVPDLRGRFPMGAGAGGTYTDVHTGQEVPIDSRSLGEMGGEERHQLTVDELPAHHHDIYAIHASDPNDPNAGGGAATAPIHSTPYHDRPLVPSEDAGGNQPHNLVPPFVAINYLIRY